jgi:hypothetical protein
MYTYTYEHITEVHYMPVNLSRKLLVQVLEWL